MKPLGSRVRTSNRQGTAVALLLAATATSARAQTDRHWLAFSLGTSQNARSTLSVRGPQTDARFHNVAWAMHPFEAAPYYVVKAGTWLGPDSRWGLELDFTHSKAIALTDQTVAAEGTWDGTPLPPTMPLNTRLQRVRFTNGVNIFSLLPIYRFARPDARIQPFAGAGPAYFLVWSNIEADRIRRVSRYHGVGQLGWTAALGVRGRVREHLSWIAEFKFTSGMASVPGPSDLRFTAPIDTRHQSVGLLWSF